MSLLVLAFPCISLRSLSVLGSEELAHQELYLNKFPRPRLFQLSFLFVLGNEELARQELN